MILSVFAKKRFGLYLMWVAAVLALVTLVLGATGHAMTTSTNFGAGQWVTILLGIACVVAAWWLRFDFWPLVPSAFFSVAFGFVLNAGVPVVVDKGEGPRHFTRFVLERNVAVLRKAPADAAEGRKPLDDRFVVISKSDSIFKMTKWSEKRKG